MVRGGTREKKRRESARGAGLFGHPVVTSEHRNFHGKMLRSAVLVIMDHSRRRYIRLRIDPCVRAYSSSLWSQRAAHGHTVFR